MPAACFPVKFPSLTKREKYPSKIRGANCQREVRGSESTRRVRDRDLARGSHQVRFQRYSLLLGAKDRDDREPTIVNLDHRLPVLVAIVVAPHALQ